MDFDEFIIAAEGLTGPLNPEQKEQFRAMEGLYREWNAKINVISRKDMDEFYLHHVLHSLAIAGYMKTVLPDDYARCIAGAGAECPSPGRDTALRTENPARSTPIRERQPLPLSFLDLGTGGGFPGIPLAVVFPGAQFTLCDSVGKKITVARDVASRLGLGNVTTVNARAESLDQKFDYVVSRAVAPLENFIPWVRGRFSRGILYLKGGDVAEETALVMARFRMKRGSVHTLAIDNWLNDSYFREKYVIFIENFWK